MITVRKARIDDIPAIRSMLAVTWRDTYLPFLSESVLAKVASEWHSAKTLEAEMNQFSTFLGVADSDSHGIVGMVTARSRAETLSITRLYVLPEFQRQDIGRRLMEESCRVFPESRRIELDVEEQNVKARSFYRKLGFAEVGMRSDDIGGIKLNSIVLKKHRRS